MKTNNIFKTFAAVAASVLICAVACDEPAPVEPATPEFPDLVENYEVAPGDTLELSFTPNMDWEMTVPEDTMDFFWIIDGSFQYSKISGKVSEEAVTVKIGVSEKTDFVNRTTSVRLTMGGETRIIAKYMRPAAGKSIQLYTCQVDEEGAWVFDEDGNYAYSEAEPQSIRLVYTGADFRIPVKVVSNLEYEVELPVWARADLPEVKTGQHEFNIYGVPSEYPLDETTATIKFKSGSEVVKEYAIVFPGCRNIMTYGVDIVSELKFSADGKYVTSIDFQEGPVTAWIEGTSLSTVVAVEMKDGKYDLASKKGPEWLAVTMAKYSSASGADVLQHRTVEVAAKAMEPSDSERAAVLLFLSEKPADLAAVFADDASAVKDEFAEYAVYVSQKEYGYITLAAEADFIAAKGTMTESDDEILLSKFGKAEYAYIMTYADQWASDKGQLLFKERYGSYKIFNKLGLEVAGDFFLSFNEERNCVEMTGELKDEGYVVFYDADAKVRAVVRCVYEPAALEQEYETDQIRDASMYLADPEAAKAVGAELDEIWAGPTFYDCEDAVTDGAVLLCLKCKENAEVELVVPGNAVFVGGYPHDCFVIDNLDLSNILAKLGNRKTVTVSFTKATDEFLSKNVQKITFVGEDYKVVLSIYCHIVE